VPPQTTPSARQFTSIARNAIEVQERLLPRQKKTAPNAVTARAQADGSGTAMTEVEETTYVAITWATNS